MNGTPRLLLNADFSINGRETIWKATVVSLRDMAKAAACVSEKALATDQVSDRASYGDGLSAVERFSALSDKPDTVDKFDKADVGGRRYRDLMPVHAPAPGEQYSFEVDLDACSGCKSCVAACHHLNGLELGESWRRVGTLLGGIGAPGPATRKQTVTSACHHCLEPACLKGCPVKAYEKDPITGIVKHLDDQCIGCRYCMFTCPYEVPQFSQRLGIVRKCDMCGDRLAAAEAPACVQACPSEAISIRTVAVEQVVAAAEAGQALPGIPDPTLTLPSTTYTSSRPLPADTLPADYHQPRQEDAHLPLVAMLVLTQVAVGLFAALQLGSALLGGAGGHDMSMTGVYDSATAVAVAIALLALSGSVLHLGRPFLAYRAMLGLRTSWLSREIALFSTFLALAMSCVLIGWLLAPDNASNYTIGGVLASVVDTVREAAPSLQRWQVGLGWAGAGIGLLAVYSSVMVYAATGRACWRGSITGGLFFATSALGGAAGLSAVLAWHRWWNGGTATPTLSWLCIAAAACMATKLAGEGYLLTAVRHRLRTPLRRRAELLLGPARGLATVRFAAGLLGVLLFAGVAAVMAQIAVDAAAVLITVAVACAAVLLGELLERHIFFIAAAAPRMPGELP